MTYPQNPWQQHQQVVGHPAHQQPNPFSAPPVPGPELTPPRRPATVEAAFWIAVLLPLLVTVLAAVGYLQLQGWVTDEIGNAGGYDDAMAQQVTQTVNNVLLGVFAVITVFYMLLTGMWIAFGFKLRAGRNWARVTLTVFAGFWLMYSLTGIASGGLAGSLGPDAHLPDSYHVLTNVQSGLGVLGMVAFLALVFVKPSNDYFQAFLRRY
ncbi:hypothetical protein GCM10009854_00530 [Saccharopolyspora halophila]|uniref:Uncharacterized protein n=1 Tax=Saccharopolyspora halophila TaxID=405551 RepID=A0ABP5SEU0_9PSEU